MDTTQSVQVFHARSINASPQTPVSGHHGQSLPRDGSVVEHSHQSIMSPPPVKDWPTTAQSTQMPSFKPSSTEKILEQFLAKTESAMAASKAAPKGLSSPSAVSNEVNAVSSSITKTNLRSTLATSLAPKSGVLPSQNQSQQMEPSKIQATTESKANPGVEGPSHPNDLMEDVIEARPYETRDALRTELHQNAYFNTSSPSHVLVGTPLGRPPTATRTTHTYVLPDGTITHSGKGLGRGRPGIKRGPRKSKLSTEITPDSPSSTVATPPPVSVPVPITPASRKRKQSDASASEDSTSQMSRSASSTPEYTPLSTQTRSGRQTQKPASFGPTPSPSATQISANASNSPTTNTESAQKKPRNEFAKPQTPITHPKIKRKIYRGREALALCEHCLRGHGPAGNVIVFCDACNKCWHQKCHDPSISKETVADKNAEWFCRECDEILHPIKKREPGGKKAKKKRKPTRLAVSDAPTSAAAMVAGAVSTSERPGFPTAVRASTADPPPTLMTGASLTRDQRLAYLNALPKERLVDLVMRASDLAPHLSLFESPGPPPGPAQVPSQPQSYSFIPATLSPSSTRKPLFEENDSGNKDDGFHSSEEPEGGAEELEWEYVLDEVAQLYPKPGHGVKLPPESLDLHMLLEGPECRTFSHWVARGVGKENVDGRSDLSRSPWPQPGSNSGPIALTIG